MHTLLNPKLALTAEQPTRHPVTSLLSAAVNVLVIGSLLALSSQSALAQPREISSRALQQIRVLLNEKASRTPVQRKISSLLLVSAMKRRGAEMIGEVPQLRTTAVLREDDTTLVDIRGPGTQTLLEQVRAVGGTVVSTFPNYQSTRAWVPIDQLEKLAASPNVRSIRPADLYQIHQTDTSEGDQAHRADVARATFGVDGSGVRIGVLSDSVEALSNLQGSGDLPTVTVLPGQAGIGSSEGTAMLEIVHDLAPGAELFFASALGGQARFAQNILDLQAAGCDVIVDDVGYFAESVFQDGIIAQAVNTVVAAGAQYYSSAGNSGNLNDTTSGVWEGDFVPIAAPAVIPGQGQAHDFGGGTNFNRITGDTQSVFTLQWSDPQGGSANDYDLFLLNADLTAVFDSSTNTQDGDDDPFEIISSQDFNDVNNVLVVIRNSGAQDRFLHLNTNRGRLEAATAGQTSGHSAAEDAFSVAAVNVATANGGAFTGGATNPVETFSSDGPRRIFYQVDGSPVTPGNFSSTGGTLRQKPDIAAADGVSTATPNFATFFGTSASAPHAAAIGALLIERNPALTPAEARTILNSTALDIEAPGVDRDSGAGIIAADAAVAAAVVAPPPLTALTVTKALSPANVVYTITVNNAGPGDAQGVVVTETLPSGVTFVSTSGCAEDGNGVPTCTLGTIPAGGSKQYTVTVAVTAESVGLLSNQPTIGTNTANSGGGGTPSVTVTRGGTIQTIVSQPSSRNATAGQGTSININIRVPGTP